MVGQFSAATLPVGVKSSLDPDLTLDQIKAMGMGRA